jgi:hypothetical protein
MRLTSEKFSDEVGWPKAIFSIVTREKESRLTDIMAVNFTNKAVPAASLLLLYLLVHHARTSGIPLIGSGELQFNALPFFRKAGFGIYKAWSKQGSLAKQMRDPARSENLIDSFAVIPADKEPWSNCMAVADLRRPDRADTILKRIEKLAEINVK